MVALLAATMIDVVIRRGASMREQPVILAATTHMLRVVAVLFVGLGFASSWFPANSVDLQALLQGLLFAGIPLLGLLQVLLRTRQSRHMFMALTLVVVMTDLTRYFWHVSYIDNAVTVNHILKGFSGDVFGIEYPDPAFTERLWNSKSPIPPAFEASLRRPWPPPDPTRGGDAGLIANLPLVTTFWPINWYLSHRFVTDVRAAPTYFARQAFWGPSVDLYESALLVEEPGHVASTFGDAPGPLLNHRIVLVQERGPYDGVIAVAPALEVSDVRLDPRDDAAWDLSGLERVADSPPSAGIFRTTREPRMTYTGALDACLADYDFLYVRTSAAMDVQPRHVVISYLLDHQDTFSVDRRFGIALAIDDEEHAYAYAFARTPHRDRVRRIVAARRSRGLHRCPTGQECSPAGLPGPPARGRFHSTDGHLGRLAV